MLCTCTCTDRATITANIVYTETTFYLFAVYPYIGTPETDVYIQYLPNSLLRIQSVNVEKIHYVTFREGKFKGGVPSNDNDLFELVPLASDSNIVVLRLVNPNQHSSGSGSGSAESESVESGSGSEAEDECYLGFADTTSEAKCYKSTEFAATRFVIIH